MDIIKEVLVSENELSEISKRLGRQISKDYENKNLLLVCLLKGSILFTADLMRKITVPCAIDFMMASSYSGTKGGTGKVDVTKDLSVDIKDYDVLIVEDIIESGYTLTCIMNMLKSRNPKSLKICTLLDKPQCRKVPVTADYVGKSIPNDFVLGYGLDYNELYRNLPFVGIINPECI